MSLSKFYKQYGTHLNRFPSVDRRPLDLYKLKRSVEARGGFKKVSRDKKWAEIGRDLGYSGKIMSSLSTSLKILTKDGCILMKNGEKTPSSAFIGSWHSGTTEHTRLLPPNISHLSSISHQDSAIQSSTNL